MEFGNITETDYLYTPAGLTAMQRKTSAGANLYYIHTDNLGSIQAITNTSGVLKAEYVYTPWGGRITLTSPPAGDLWGFDRGYTGHEHLTPFGDDTNGGFCLINMNGRVYDPVLARFLSPDPYVQAPDFTQSFNRYAYCWNNPFKYTDPSGEFITWSIGNGGFSIGLNFTPIGIPLGFGINIGWSNGGSAGLYGEVGFRVGGTGFGSGITVQQSLNYSFGNGSLNTATSVGAYASFGVFNVGANVSYTYRQNRVDWGVSAGVGIGGDGSGIGVNLGYGSNGFTYGIGGYYDYSKNRTKIYNLPPTDYSPEGDLPIHTQIDKSVGCTQEVFQSFIEYEYGVVPNTDNSTGTDFTQLANMYDFASERQYNDAQRVGRALSNGNPTAITYDNNGVLHTVGVNEVRFEQRAKLFVGGYPIKTKIQVMDPLHKSYQTLPITTFNSNSTIIRTLFFKK